MKDNCKVNCLRLFQKEIINEENLCQMSIQITAELRANTKVKNYLET